MRSETAALRVVEKSRNLRKGAKYPQLRELW